MGLSSRFSTAAAKPSKLTALRDPHGSAGAPRPPQRTLQHVCGGLRPAPCQVGGFPAS